MSINERQIALRKGGNYTNLDNYFDRNRVIPLPFNETAVVTVSAANFALLDSSMTAASNLSIGLGTTTQNGLFAALLAGAVGTGSTNTISDTVGNVLNLVKIRDASTHDAITEASGREVYGLIQSVSTATDGDAIGAAASENVQISFVYIAANGTLTLTNVTATVEFGQNNNYLERNQPTTMMLNGNPSADALQPDPTSATQGEYTVTTAFVADEVITLSTGAGATAGVTTKTGDTIALGASASAMFDNHLLTIMLNGVEQEKGVDVVWDTSGTMHFSNALDIGDVFYIKLLS